MHICWTFESALEIHPPTHLILISTAFAKPNVGRTPVYASPIVEIDFGFYIFKSHILYLEPGVSCVNQVKFLIDTSIALLLYQLDHPRRTTRHHIKTAREVRDLWKFTV
jgi:hypothetical protein